MKKTRSKYRKSPFLLISLLLLTTSLFAQVIVYQKTTPDGKISFSDTPSADATPYKLKPANIYSATPSSTDHHADETEKQNTPTAQSFYQKFSLIQPADQQNFHNEQEITALTQIEPVLRSGDTIAWWLDGKLYQQNTSTQITLSSLERGEHNLQVKVMDDKKHMLIATPQVTFYLHYASTP